MRNPAPYQGITLSEVICLGALIGLMVALLQVPL